MREPAFWYGPPSWMSRLLMPLGALYGAVTAWRMARAGALSELPVFCIGNYHVGGAGKTPVTMALAAMLREMGEQPFVVSRGYGGQLGGPLRVDPNIHAAADVGDEPLMMGSSLPVIVSRDRVAGATLASAQGASVILLDDGFQNPALAKDASFIVIDSGRGVGNACVFPAGPLRTPLVPQIARTDALIVVGHGKAAEAVASVVAAQDAPVLRAVLQPDQNSLAALRGKSVLAFAGIGDPVRFFATLRTNGVNVADTASFPDHHPYSIRDMEKLTASAAARSLTLVTTEKDIARLRNNTQLSSFTAVTEVFAVTLVVENAQVLRDFLAESLGKARSKRR